MSRVERGLIGFAALALHAVVIYGLAQREQPVLPEIPIKVPLMAIEFAVPAEPITQTAAPPVAEPPPPPPPVEDEMAAKPKPKPKPKPLLKPTPVPQKAEEPPQPPQPPAPPARPSPPPQPAETPPSANAGYLRNPAPEYPAAAQRRTWEGTVLLRVHVQPNGKPSEVQIQQSSGHEVLDKAAVRAVERWSFEPAKRGNESIAGWVTVPLDFHLN